MHKDYAHLIKDSMPAKGGLLPMASKGEALDSVKTGLQPALDTAGSSEGSVYDSASFASAGIEVDAVSAAQQWAIDAEGGLSEGEGLGDRLFAMIAGIADEDMDGEISEDEAEIILLATNAVGNYLIAKGVDEDEVAQFLEDFDNDIAESIADQLSLPESEEEQAGEVDEFVFGDGSDESALDSASEESEEGSATDGCDSEEEGAMDAAYKKKKVVRNGKKVIINKRVSGRVKLSAKQKQAIKKARRKAHSAGAKRKRMKSMKRAVA